MTIEATALADAVDAYLAAEQENDVGWPGWRGHRDALVAARDSVRATEPIGGATTKADPIEDYEDREADLINLLNVQPDVHSWAEMEAWTERARMQLAWLWERYATVRRVVNG